MFKLNRLTDYGVVVLTLLAQQRPGICGPKSAQALAERGAMPLPTVAKILNLLAKGGLVTSQRGATGGYVLSRSASAITVADIVTALEGPIALTACADGSEESCDAERLCPMAGNWNKVNIAIRQALSDVSLADMTSLPFYEPLAPASLQKGAP